MPKKLTFSINCKKCKRLVKFLKEVKKEHSNYYCKPVPAFGDTKAQVLIVGLAPGLHGANATGRPFTGDQSGLMLFKTLHKHGFSNKPVSESADDDLKLINCRITNAVKCLPPQNKPVGDEISTCNKYLEVELSALPENSVVIALGSIAHKAVIKAFNLRQKDYKFSHLSEYILNTKNSSCTLVSSYHCSRYNTQTKRLTEEMFNNVFARTKAIISHV